MGSPLSRLIAELRRRRVILVLTIYFLAGWPVIQLADILTPALGLPDASMQYLLIAFAAGFPLVIAFSWIFDLNKTGLAVTPEAPDEADEPLLPARTESVVVVGLSLAIVALFALQYVAPDEAVANRDAVIEEPPPRSIAVLPFATFSDDSNDGYFADGLTEELLNALASVQELKVAARTSSFAYKGVNKHVQKIGRELGVESILEGSVRRNDVDDTIRVTAQLIDVRSGSHLWSNTFDREFRDIFRIQDDIADAVVKELRVQLLGEANSAASPPRGGPPPEALVAMAKGRTELAKRTRESLLTAAGHFEEVTTLAPKFAPGWAGLADARSLLASYGAPNRSALLEGARAASDRAIELNPQLSAAWASRGLLHMQRRGERELAREALDRAVELNPNNAMAIMWSGQVSQDPEQRIAFHRRAFELDPRSPVAAYNVANDHLQAGDEARAMEVFGKIVEADPYYPRAYVLVARANEFRGRLGEAVLNYKRVYELDPDPDIASKLAEVFFDMGDFEQGDAWLARADADGRPNPQLVWLKAGSLVARGEADAGRDLLKRMLQAPRHSQPDHLNAAFAAYHLEDYALTVSEWEAAAVASGNGKPGGPRELRADAALAAAHAYRKLGRVEASDVILDEWERRVSSRIEDNPRPEPYLWYRHASVATIRGDRAAALRHIQRAIDEGWHQHWRPHVEPALAELRDDRDFQAMMSGLETRMRVMREQLAYDEALRAKWRG